jgi:hypothetical protein
MVSNILSFKAALEKILECLFIPSLKKIKLKYQPLKTFWHCSSQDHFILQIIKRPPNLIKYFINVLSGEQTACFRLRFV